MLADAEQSTALTPPTHELTALLPLKPCRFCGETERLTCDPYGAEEQFKFTEDLTIVRGPTGEPVDHTEAHIWCKVCDAGSPITLWNASVEDGAKVRAATLAAWDEYSGEDGSWIGARQ